MPCMLAEIHGGPQLWPVADFYYSYFPESGRVESFTASSVLYREQELRENAGGMLSVYQELLSAGRRVFRYLRF